MQAFDAAGIRVYALSYDEQEPLADFSEAYNITYKLLSDPKSEVIRQFGILNTIIPEDDHPWFGIPYPGTYLLDSTGTITHKFFENNLAVRVGPEQLLRAFRGETLADLAIPTLESAPEGTMPEKITASIFLEGETLALSVQRELVARISVPTGSHLYASPAPQGMVAVNIKLDANPLLVLRDIVRPSSETHSLSGTAKTFEVHHGQVELRLPITINGAVTRGGGPNEVLIAGSLHWQSCNDEVCDLPATQRFELTVPVDRPVLPQIGVPDDKRTIEPRAGEHFQQMIHRHKK
jgi:hypothetical protein